MNRTIYLDGPMHTKHVANWNTYSKMVTVLEIVRERGEWDYTNPVWHLSEEEIHELSDDIREFRGE